MFVKNDTDYEQVTLFNSMAGLTEREKRFLEKSWAKPFAEYIFPAIDEAPFAVLYSNRPSKGNTPVNILVGACILQQITDLSDDEFLNSLMFDIRFQYALHTNDFEEQPLSDRSLGRFRARCLAYETEISQNLRQRIRSTASLPIISTIRIIPATRNLEKELWSRCRGQRKIQQ